MQQDGPQIVQSDVSGSQSERGSRKFLPSSQCVGDSQVKLLLSAFLLVCVLFAYEIAHYLISTHLGATDHAEASTLVHPQCRELRSRYELLCPFPGYNSVELMCITESCGAFNPNLSPTTSEDRIRQTAAYRSDSIASLKIEAPYHGGDPDWQEWAHDLRTGRESLPTRVPMDQPPQRVQDAWRIVQERSLMISRQIAQEHLNERAE